MKRFFLTLGVLFVIIVLCSLFQELVGYGGIGLAAALGVIAGELGWSRIVRPDRD